MNQDQHAHYLRILVKCWEDPAYRAALLAEPRRVLEAEGIALPKGEVHVVEDSADAIYLVLPPKPAEGELSDDALEAVAAGSGFGGRPGCFITTATLKARGKGGAEAEAILDRFRAFRDGWLRPRPEGETIIADYYRCAPKLVAALDRDPDSDLRYRELWQGHLLPCLENLDRDDPESAYRRYLDMVAGLKQRYPEAA